MRIYTRKGDEGRTSVIGDRVDKDHHRVETNGALDECNAAIGQAVAEIDDTKAKDLIRDLLKVQYELFDAGADIAQANKVPAYKMTVEHVNQLEALIDKYDAETPELRHFVLPGGTRASAALHMARVITRRAERRMVTLAKRDVTNEQVRHYLNRLSDLLFVMARVMNVREGVPDVIYHAD